MEHNKRILLVDDNDADNEFHVFVINQADASLAVESIDDSRKALVFFEHCFADEKCPVPDVLFLDINMPAMTGFELLDQLRELPDPYHHREAIKIFMLTGSLNPDDSMLAQQQYADLVTGFQVKPLTKQSLENIWAKYF